VVNFAEGVPLTKVLLIKFNRRLCDSEHKVRPHVLVHGSTDEDPLWRVHGVVVLMNDVVTRADTVQVARDPGSLLKLCNRNFGLVLIKVEEVSDVMPLEHTSALMHLEALLDRVADR
jgi:hypothetical protein